MKTVVSIMPTLRKQALMATATVMVLAAFAAPAFAQPPRRDNDQDWRRMSWSQHEREARKWHTKWRHAPSPARPRVVYVPPPVVYAPPPPSPGISLIIPLDFR